jgi:hypothetical protein
MNKKSTCTRQNLQNTLNKADIFGTPIKLNFDGKEHITSTPGALLTLVLGFVSLAFMV